MIQFVGRKCLEHGQGCGEQGWQGALGRLLEEVIVSHGSKEGREAATPMWGRTPGRGNKGRPGGCQEQHGGEGTISRPLSLRGRESKPSCPSVSLSPPRRARPGCSTVLLESPPSSPATGPVSLQRPPPSTPPAPAYPLSPFGRC